MRLNQAAGRWVLVVTVLGSSMAFLDGTVVNVALHTIKLDLHTGLSGVQWTVDAYLLTLGSLVVLGGSLGDIYGRRRVFLLGVMGFSLTSLLCGISPTAEILILARAGQGIAGALLVPSSLAIISATFASEDRGRAIGIWSGATSAVIALGPLAGGWLVGVNWRLIFLINLPVGLAAVLWGLRHLPGHTPTQPSERPDLLGAAVISLGLGGVVFALIEGPVHGWGAAVMVLGSVGVLALVLFPLLESRIRQPMVPLGIFRSLQFSGANVVTFAVYAALGVSSFLTVTYLQDELGYTPIGAGLAFLPATLLLIALSSRMGALTSRIGPRIPMTAGPVLLAVGLILLSAIGEQTNYIAAVLPGVIVFGLGLALTVAPLTTTIMSSVERGRSGLASAINNAVARVGSLLAVALLPAVTGLASALGPHTPNYVSGYRATMLLCAGLTSAAAVVAAISIRRIVEVG